MPVGGSVYSLDVLFLVGYDFRVIDCPSERDEETIWIFSRAHHAPRDIRGQHVQVDER